MSAGEPHSRYEAIFAGIEAPFAFVDLDALWSNADYLLARRNDKPIRIASKSVRCTALLRRVLDRDEGFRGLLCFTVPEALHLTGQGFRELVVGYPTTDRAAIARLAELASAEPGGAPALMVDDRAQLDLIEGASVDAPAPIGVCIDVDASWRPLGRRAVAIGPKRSPVRTPADAAALAREIEERPGVRLEGLMAYEGQIAGVGDATPGRPLRNLAIRAMQRASARELRGRRAEVVAAVREVAELRFVNGGGTGSLERTAAEEAVTEVTAGSGLYAPVLFDHYRGLELRPAAAFALPIVRRSEAGAATALGGGDVASGAPGRDRLPEPFLPSGLRLDAFEGAGEVQTPLVGPGANALRIGDRVYLRHAKAGELCERFASLYLVEGDAIVDEVPTYRGEGRCFL